MCPQTLRQRVFVCTCLQKMPFEKAVFHASQDALYKKIGPHVSQTTFKCGLNDWILRQIKDTFTHVLRAVHLCSDQPGCMVIPGMYGLMHPAGTSLYQVLLSSVKGQVKSAVCCPLKNKLTVSQKGITASFFCFLWTLNTSSSSLFFSPVIRPQ